jgi:hypothetical protein
LPSGLIASPTRRWPTPSATACCGTRTDSCYKDPRDEGGHARQLTAGPASLRTDHARRSA